MLGIVVTTENEVYTKEFSRPLYESAGKVLGGWVEHVLPRGLPRPLCMLVDDEGLLKDSPKINVIGTYLYGSPIAGNIIIMQDGIHEGEPDIVGLSEEEARHNKQWLVWLANQVNRKK